MLDAHEWGEERGASMDQVIVFDVNETLLDVGALDSFFHDRFGDAAVCRE
jgi:hypothetical protein